MSIHQNTKKVGIKVEANIDPCRTCVVRDVKSPEHCESCDHSPFKKKNATKDFSDASINSIIIFS